MCDAEQEASDIQLTFFSVVLAVNAQPRLAVRSFSVATGVKAQMPSRQAYNFVRLTAVRCEVPTLL